MKKDMITFVSLFYVFFSFFFIFNIVAVPMNINSASAQAVLGSLSRISMRKAESIFNYRNINDPLKTAGNITTVSGIGDRTIKKNKSKAIKKNKRHIPSL